MVSHSPDLRLLWSRTRYSLNRQYSCSVTLEIWGKIQEKNNKTSEFRQSKQAGLLIVSILNRSNRHLQFHQAREVKLKQLNSVETNLGKYNMTEITLFLKSNVVVHRITAWLSWQGPLGPPAPCLCSSRNTQSRVPQTTEQSAFEDLQQLWATYSRALAPKQWRSASWCFERTFCVAVCNQCLLEEPASVLCASFLQTLIYM